MTDGLLVHSENWQALRLLEEKYRQGIQCIYIDPPYNTTDYGFLYKNSYKHSSWMTMMGSRLELGSELLATTGVIQVAINDTETHNLRTILDRTLGDWNRLATLVAQVNPAGQNLRPNAPSLSHDYCHVYARNVGASNMSLRPLTDRQREAYTEFDGTRYFVWDNLRGCLKVVT